MFLGTEVLVKSFAFNKQNLNFDAFPRYKITIATSLFIDSCYLLLLMLL